METSCYRVLGERAQLPAPAGCLKRLPAPFYSRPGRRLCRGSGRLLGPETPDGTAVEPSLAGRWSTVTGRPCPRREGQQAPANPTREETLMDKPYPCLWFNGQAEEAARFYVSVFKNSRIVATSYFPEGLPRPPGSVMTVNFVLDGQKFLALNGGPEFQFSPAVSFVVSCDTQGEVDTLWSRLTEGGMEVQCGWLTDKYGISWQIVPKALPAMLTSTDKAAARRAAAAMMGMKKLDIAALKQAFDGA